MTHLSQQQFAYLEKCRLSEEDGEPTERQEEGETDSSEDAKYEEDA